MGHYKVRKQDLFFVLKEQLNYGQLCQYERYKELSENALDMVVSEAVKFAHGVVEPLRDVGEETGIRYEEGKVVCPPEYRAALKQCGENGFIAAARDTTYGGEGLPLMMRIIINELFYGAYQSFNILPSLTHGAGHLIESFGSADQKNHFVRRMYAGEWAGTMALTEPTAGSNLGNINTKAVRDGDHFKISGSKIFITYGEHDAAENIIHLVLARLEGAPEGVQGLSLFIVPKILVDDDGKLREANDLFCVRVEKKMGLHGAPTTVMNFGDNNRCVAYLCGEENAGLHNMFQLMNQARINSGVSGMTMASSAYLNALEYCKERIQGVDIAKRKRGFVPIIDHPDVRRMLLGMKGTVEGLRSMIYFGAFVSDLADSETEPHKRKRYGLLLDFLTPIIKAYSSHMGFELCSTAMQCFGGSGYMRDYPVEMYLRDIRAAALYEGTNGIQSIDLSRRKMTMENGAALQAFLQAVNDFTKQNEKHRRFTTEVLMLQRTLGQMEEVCRRHTAYWQDEPLSAASRSFPLLLCFGDVVLIWRLLDMAVIAERALTTGTTDKNFYLGKILAATYVAKELLPQTQARLGAIMEGAHEIIEATEEQF